METKIKLLNKALKIADIYDLYSNEESSFLDSSLVNKLGKYSIIGINPFLTIVKDKGELLVNGELKNEKFEDYLKKILKENYSPNLSELPISSGAIGYLSYDYNNLDYIKNNIGFTENIPECAFRFYDNFIVQNHETEEIYISGNSKLMSAEQSIDKIILDIEDMITSMDENKEENKEEFSVEIDANFEKEGYLKSIEKMIAYIEEGHIYVANLTQKLRLRSKQQPYDVFKKLRINNPAPFGAYLNFENFQIISASPERFLKMKDKLIETRPIKGTRKRSDDKEEDDMLREELRTSEKDKSELLMIIDLERNDLSKICKKNTVKVDELFSIEEYATVFHLVANVKGELENDYDIVDLMKAMFPGGSITGAPKKRAMEIIEELENGPRGLYTGGIGYISFDGSCDFNIVIRTAIHQDSNYYLGVGGGITYESDLEFEYEETFQKAKAIIEAVK